MRVTQLKRKTYAIEYYFIFDTNLHRKIRISATLQDWRVENIFHFQGKLSLQDSLHEGSDQFYYFLQPNQFFKGYLRFGKKKDLHQ